MVWPGMNQVAGISNLASSCRSRSVPTMPKSPREIIVGVVVPRETAIEVLSRSKVRQTKCCGMARSSRAATLTRRAAHCAQRDADEPDQRDQRPRAFDDRGREIELSGERQQDQAGADEVQGERRRALRV